MKSKEITLAISSRNDYVGIWYTFNSALLSIKGTDMQGKLNFAILNNSDDERSRNFINAICSKFSIKCKVIADVFSNHRGRNEAVKLSETEYTVLADSHVQFSHGFFDEYVHVLKNYPDVGLIHCPFTNGGMPSWRSNCFYNLQKFQYNLHGSFSRRGALEDQIYPVALAPHPSYGFRTKQWLDYGGYIDECLGNGGGEPYVTYKYWMFGSTAYLTPRVGMIHFNVAPYRRSRSQWKRNHTITALALGGYNVGLRYAKYLNCVPFIDKLWEIAKPYHDFVKKKRKIKFDDLMAHWKKVKARPFYQG